MTRVSRHIEWLSLIEVSGPFLASTVLDKAFPQGLEAVETPRRQRLRAAYEEWREAVDEDDPQLHELHNAWIHLVLAELLEYDDEVLIRNGDLTEPLSYVPVEHSGVFCPDLLVQVVGDEKPRLLLSIQNPGTDLDTVQRGDGWPVSLIERMVFLCRSAGVRLGLITNGERWVLVNAPVDSTSAQAGWYARLWFQEPITLKAFQSLLGVRRAFGPRDESLEALLEESLEHQEEVTSTLGEQVRRAIEVLVQSLDKADEDRNRDLLRDVQPAELYEAGLTVMMRLVFILSAEERGLLLLGDPVYDQYYAVSTLRSQLAGDADQHGPEVLDRRYDAWSRLLAVFRAVYGGVEHDMLRMPALGGSLFDPDRFPFLEGRDKGSHWRDMTAIPLPVDNRTVLLLLNALQVLEQRSGALLLSYKSLDVEQIGHVYEGLLDYTVERSCQITIGLKGTQKAKNPNVPLSRLESARMESVQTAADLLREITGSSESAICNALARPVDGEILTRVLHACGGDTELAGRIRPYAHLLRADAWGEYILYRANAFMVTLGNDRRETGTHYSPKLLTESIVSATLEPLVYIGLAEGQPQGQWKLRSSTELLDLKICDPTMGSGAFLVQVCRWLSERLVEAWGREESEHKFITIDGEAIEHAGDSDPMPQQLDDRLLIARRLIAERCLYGVDMNHMAVQLAKLSIWLVTMAKGRPFGFLDHNLRCGDSLLGIYRLDQLTKLAIGPESDCRQPRIFGHKIEDAVTQAGELRKNLRARRILDIRDVEAMAQLDDQTRKVLAGPELVADALVGEALRTGSSQKGLESALSSIAAYAGEYFAGEEEFGRLISSQSRTALSVDLPTGGHTREPFHWPLEFPEVFGRENGGFDAVVGNPPFITGKRISTFLGEHYQDFLKHTFPNSNKPADICVFFLRRGFDLLRSNSQIGVILTKSVAEGDSRLVGTAWLISQGATIYWVRRELPWPGEASVTVSLLVMRKGTWGGSITLDGHSVMQIGSRLTEENYAEPNVLLANKGLCSDGVKTQGDGFIISDDERSLLIGANPRNSEVIKPYITGMDIVQRIGACPSSWIIAFGTMTHAEAASYREPFELLVERVKPYRDSLTGQIHETDFWKFWDKREVFFARMKGKGRILACPATAKYLVMTFIDERWVPSHSVKVFAMNSSHGFAVMQSSVHETWVRRQSGKLEQRLAYNLTKGFLTFPWPSQQVACDVADSFLESRTSLSLEKLVCITDMYNMFHDAYEADRQISNLRVLHSKMDQAVAIAYGWNDIDLEHGFHDTEQGLRYTISGAARQEILCRLLDLSHHRYEEEVHQGLHKARL